MCLCACIFLFECSEAGEYTNTNRNIIVSTLTAVKQNAQQFEMLVPEKTESTTTNNECSIDHPHTSAFSLNASTRNSIEKEMNESVVGATQRSTCKT